LKCRGFDSKVEIQKLASIYVGASQGGEWWKKSLGDYFALAKTDKYFRYCEDSVNLKSMHAGYTEDEMLIPLIIYYK
jgi:hypothetical protein